MNQQQLFQKHELSIRYFKNGTGFTASCSCGAALGRPSGCNRGGIDYALVATWERYADHCRGLGKKPMPNKDCQGLAGVEGA